MGALLKIYHHLPSFGRDMAVSVHGFNLDRWRYGPETDLLAAEALGREMWSAGEWDKWQQARLREMLFRAAGTVPWYREYWERRRAGGDLKSPGELKHWPLLDKQAVHADPKAFLSDDIASGRLQPVSYTHLTLPTNREV